MSVVATTARARVRAEVTREIMDVARAHLVERGAHDLSLRAVARDLGMAPSGLYRYFAGRDELLTALIIDSYGALGAAAVAADAATPQDDHLRRWAAVTGAIWAWGHEHPQEWALIYGSPVPGYRAPQDTVDAARIVIDALVGVVVSAAAAGRLAPAAQPVTDPGSLRPTIEGVRAVMGEVDDAHVVATVVAFAEIIGLISLHLFGHLENAVDRAELLWDQAMADRAQLIGLRPADQPVPSPVDRLRPADQPVPSPADRLRPNDQQTDRLRPADQPAASPPDRLTSARSTS